MTETDSDATPSRLLQWLAIAGLVGGVVLAIGMGATTAHYGGIPHAYHRYGIVAVPGRQVLALPEGRVMLDHADDVDGCWNNTGHIENASIYNAPEGMAVRVVPLTGAKPLKMTSVPIWLYTNQTNCRGHEPFGRIDVPTAGTYLVETTDTAHGGFVGAPDPRGAMTRPSTSGAGVAFGPKPWAPFGSPLLAGVIVAAIVLGLVGVPLRSLRGRF